MRRAGQPAGEESLAAMSERIADLGLDGDVPQRQEAASTPRASELRAEDWFLWSRIDGRTSIRELFTMSGQSRDDTVASLQRLHDCGLIELPGRERKASAGRVGEDDLPCPEWFGAYESFRPDPQVMDGESALPAALRKLVMYYTAYMARVSYYDVLLVGPEDDKDTISRSYYRLSKLFHPDRWFRQPLGPLEVPLREVFAWVSKAYRTLSDSQRRADYDAVLRQGSVGPWVREGSSGSPAAGQARAEPRGHGLGHSALLARGRRLRADGRYPQAVSCMRRALKLGDDVNLSLELAEVQLEGGIDLLEALGRLRRVAEANPTNYAARFLEARILRSMGARDDARAVCEAILRERPEHAGARALLRVLDAR